MALRGEAKLPAFGNEQGRRCVRPADQQMTSRHGQTAQVVECLLMGKPEARAAHQRVRIRPDGRGHPFSPLAEFGRREIATEEEVLVGHVDKPSVGDRVV